MLPFSSQGGATLRYRAEFIDNDYANISFFDHTGGEILFHLSLRADEGLAVCNRRDAHVWGAEITRQVALDPAGTQVEISFAPPRVQVRLDGRPVFSFGGLLRRRHFEGIERIGFFDFQGGIAMRHISADLPAQSVSTPELVLTERLEIAARGLEDEAALATCRLEVAGIDARPVLAARSYPYTLFRGGRPVYEPCAVLPGRIWRMAGERNELELRLWRGERVLATLALRRADLARRIEAILATPPAYHDPLAEMLAIEHVRFAGLAPLLGAPARAQLGGMARFYRLEDFLCLEAESNTAAIAEPAPEDEDTAVGAAHRRFIETLAAMPERAPAQVLKEILAEGALTDAARQRLLLAVTEFFCSRERFGELFDLVGEADRAALVPVGDAWRASAALPWLLGRGQHAALSTAIAQLGEIREGWIVTPALAWVIRQGVETVFLPRSAWEKILKAFFQFVEEQAADYRARTPCAALIDAMVHLVANADRLDEKMQPRLSETILRVYGLSRRFWECFDAAVAAGRLHPPAVLRAGREAFAIIAAHLEDGEGTQAQLVAALDVFARADNPEAARYQRELLGPAEIPLVEGSAPMPEALVRAGRDPGEAALRYLAFPGAAPGEGGTLTEEAARALPARYLWVPRAPHYRLQCGVGRQAAALAARAAAGGAPPRQDEIDALAAGIAVLADARSHFIGLGAGLALIDALVRAQVVDPGARLLDHLAQAHAALSAEEAAAAAAAPALQGPLDALARLEVRTASPLARDARALLSDSAHPVAPPDLPLPDWAHASPVFDTIVTVFSCKPNLEDRIPAMRAGWLKLLESVGVPYVVVVGDGDGRLMGDILHLDASDDYEGLPDKTLAAIRWVHDHTPFAHMLKIDDDCFLEPLEFFHSLSWRKFDYYGRALARRPGQMDRAWHCAKARSARGRLELDKSPEPSIYADGGSGYALSRTAMVATLEAAQTPAGRQLRQVSFMEDKLLGDLLALKGIAVADEDYRVSIRRRTHGTAQPVSMWVNGFHASRAAPVKLVHLDTHLDQGAALERLTHTDLRPKKIWPGYAPVTLGYQSNALELVSDEARLEHARDAPVAVVAVMRNEMFIAPHFLAHYRRLGVEAFLIADNLSDDGTLEYLADQPDVALFSVDTDYSHSHYGVAWQQALMGSFRMNRWSLIADADELLFWQEEPHETLPELLARPEFESAEAARVFMLDMYPKGPLEEADFASGDPFTEAGFVDRNPFRTDWPGRGPFSNAPTWTSALRHRLIPGSRADLFVAQKIALMRYRPWMRLSAGLHFVADTKLSERELLFAHFKYNADFRRKARAEVARRQHFNDAEEYRKYLALASEGRETIFDPAVSVPWREAEFVRRILAGGSAEASALGCTKEGGRG